MRITNKIRVGTQNQTYIGPRQLRHIAVEPLSSPSVLHVGLTGNIASGKSTVAGFLKELGAELIDADVLSRQAVRPGSPALDRIASRWGSEVLNPDGTLDRAALRHRVFSDHDELEALNQIVHPEVKRLRDRELEDARERGERIVISDIPLLFERGLANEFDLVILVDAPRPLRLERLVRDRGLHETEAMQMIAAQMPAELKRARADHVIENDGTIPELEERVGAVWKQLVNAAAKDAPRHRNGVVTPADGTPRGGDWRADGA